MASTVTPFTYILFGPRIGFSQSHYPRQCGFSYVLSLSRCCKACLAQNSVLPCPGQVVLQNIPGPSTDYVAPRSFLLEHTRTDRYY